MSLCMFLSTPETSPFDYLAAAATGVLLGVRMLGGGWVASETQLIYRDEVRERKVIINELVVWSCHLIDMTTFFGTSQL